MTEQELLAKITAGADFFSCTDGEELSHECPIEALEDYLDGFFSPTADVAKVIREDVGSVTLRCYSRIKVDVTAGAKRVACSLAKNAAEIWDEEHGGPDGQMDLADAEVEKFEAAILPSLVALYSSEESWNCEEVGSVELSAEDVESLMREASPGWFEGAKT